ncbi:hypothetical protein D3C86_746500 [compost metagenome]
MLLDERLHLGEFEFMALEAQHSGEGEFDNRAIVEILAVGGQIAVEGGQDRLGGDMARHVEA